MDTSKKSREKMYIKAYALLIILILAGSGFYSYKKYMDYDFLKKGFASNEVVLKELATASVSEQNTYEDKKAEFYAFSDMVNKSVVSIFPSSEQYTELTKKMEEIEGQLSTTSNPIEISNITYQKPIKLNGYSVLPFRMSVRASNANFTKFLKMIESSGSVDSGLRLMDVPSIRLNFQNTDNQDFASDNEIIDFTVQVNAYFQ